MSIRQWRGDTAAGRIVVAGRADKIYAALIGLYKPKRRIFGMLIGFSRESDSRAGSRNIPGNLFGYLLLALYGRYDFLPS